MTTMNLVEKGTMKEGNMVPLVEEFEYIVKSSNWLPAGIDRSIFLFKDKNGVCIDVSDDKKVASHQELLIIRIVPILLYTC